MDDAIYLTKNQVIAINTVQIRLYSPGEQIGVKDAHLLDSAINRPKKSAFGDDAYPTIFAKSSALFESLANNHAFHNANKRTALASLIIILKINHYRWTMGIEAEQDFTVNVVNHKYSFDEIVAIIEGHTEQG
jgi:death-on-curing protein